MSGNSYRPTIGLSDEEQMRREAEAASAYDAAVAAAQNRMAGPPAPPGPPPPPSFEAFGVNVPAAPPVLKEAPPPIEMPQPGPVKEAAFGPPNEPAKGHPRGPSPAPGGSSGGSPGPAVIPGGMMPFTEKQEIQRGKPASPEVKAMYGASGVLQFQAAEKERDAANALAAHEYDAAQAKYLANEKAATDHQALMAERDQVVADRMAKIEALNKEAQGNPEDIWGSPQLFGRLVAAISLIGGFASMANGGNPATATVLAMGGGMINGLINQDIEAKMDKRRQAGKAAGRETDLLKLHEANFKDRDQAITATKLAYYDSVLAQMDKFKAENKGNVNEAAFMKTQGQILDERAALADKLNVREMDTVTEELVNKYRPPQALGGGAPAAKVEGATVRLPDNTVYAFEDKEGARKYAEHLNANLDMIHNLNELKDLRAKTKEMSRFGKDSAQYVANLARMKTLDERIMNTMSQSEGQGVVHKEEAERWKKTHDPTAGLEVAAGIPYVGEALYGATDAVINDTIRGLNREIVEHPKATGRIIKDGYAVDPLTGRLSVDRLFTGQNPTPAPELAPPGSVPMDSRRGVPVAGPSAEKTTPPAPVFPRAPAARGKK